MEYFQRIYDIDYALFEVVVPPESELVGKKLDDVETDYRVRMIATKGSNGRIRIGRGDLARDFAVEASMVLGVIASPKCLAGFVEKFDLRLRNGLKSFAESLASTKAGIAELVIPPGSQLIGKSARDVWLRKTYGIAMVALHRNGETLQEGDHIRDLPLKAPPGTPWCAWNRTATLSWSPRNIRMKRRARRKWAGPVCSLPSPSPWSCSPISASPSHC
jgi:Trk K+ transport system NAD-binding subunit